MKTLILGAALGALVPISQAQSFAPDTFIPGLGSSVDHTLFPVDFDGDGDVDLLELDPLGTLRLSRNRGDGQMSPQSIVLSGLYEPTGVAMFDVDLDGDLDLYLGTGSFATGASYCYFYERLTTGFAPYELVANVPFADAGSIVEVHDMEGDGDLDLAVLSHPSAGNNQTAQWLRFDGPSNLTLTPLQTLDLSRDLNWVDLDGDGILDTIGVRLLSGRSQLRWSKGQLDGTLVNQGILQGFNPGGVLSMDMADLDGDGDSDILVLLSHTTREILALENLGGGAFGAPELLLTVPGAGSVEGFDVDLDGDEDPVIFLDESAFWLESLGGGNYGAPANFPSTQNAIPLWTIDMDGDRDVDLLRTGTSGPSLQLNDLRFGAGYCYGGWPNSTGEIAQISAEGTSVAAMNDVTLLSAALPPGAFGYFVVADMPGFVPNPGGSNGLICIAGQVGRFNRTGEVLQATAAGTTSLSLDLTNIPTPTGSESLMAGDTRYFQMWHRDANPSSTSNFSNGLSIVLR